MSLCYFKNILLYYYNWPLFSIPQVGHLHPGRSKELTVTFQTSEPAELKEHEVPCKLIRITFEKPLADVADWDDRIRSVKWVDVVPSSAGADG